MFEAGFSPRRLAFHAFTLATIFFLTAALAAGEDLLGARAIVRDFPPPPVAELPSPLLDDIAELDSDVAQARGVVDTVLEADDEALDEGIRGATFAVVILGVRVTGAVEEADRIAAAGANDARFPAAYFEQVRERVEALVEAHAEALARVLSFRQPFIRGDANLDRRVDISDVITVLEALYTDPSRRRCLTALDADDSGGVELTDAVVIATYLFLGGDPLPAPGPLPERDVRSPLSCREGLATPPYPGTDSHVEPGEIVILDARR